MMISVLGLDSTSSHLGQRHLLNEKQPSGLQANIFKSLSGPCDSDLSSFMKKKKYRFGKSLNSTVMINDEWVSHVVFFFLCFFLNANSDEARPRGVPLRWRWRGDGHQTERSLLHPEAGGHRELHVHVASDSRSQVQGVGLAGSGGEKKKLFCGYFFVEACFFN